MRFRRIAPWHSVELMLGRIFDCGLGSLIPASLGMSGQGEVQLSDCHSIEGLEHATKVTHAGARLGCFSHSCPLLIFAFRNGEQGVSLSYARGMGKAISP